MMIVLDDHHLFSGAACFIGRANMALAALVGVMPWNTGTGTGIDECKCLALGADLMGLPSGMADDRLPV